MTRAIFGSFNFRNGDDPRIFRFLAGLFRDLALQGVDVLLVDKSDFCTGASAASSRMIHGGLRYLEFGEFRLVRESLKDRNLLLASAAHYVKPLPTTIPPSCSNWP